MTKEEAYRLLDMVSGEIYDQVFYEYDPYEWTEEEYNALIMAIKTLKNPPPAQPTLYGYDIEHLKLIANVLQKENLPPEKITEVLTNIGRIVATIRDEFEETLRKAVKRCKI